MKRNDNNNKELPSVGYRIFKPIVIGLFKLYYNPKIYGSENIPKKGSLVICGNHIHIMDQFQVLGETNRIVHYMAKREYFDSIKTRWFFKMVGCISVDRSIKDEGAKSAALNILKQGGCIGLFPEGTRNKDREHIDLLPFKFGAVSMAKKTNSLIVPFGTRGDYKFRSKNLVCHIGKPIDISNMELEEANELLRKEIQRLKSLD